MYTYNIYICIFLYFSFKNYNNKNMYNIIIFLYPKRTKRFDFCLLKYKNEICYKFTISVICELEQLNLM